MYPVLFTFGPVTIYSYGFFLALAYLVATYIFWKEGKKQGYQEEKLLDFSILALIAALVGGRIFYIILHFEIFKTDFRKMFYFWEGGFAYFGSLVLVFLVASYLIRKWRWSFLQIADIGALSVLVATFVAKIGSLLSGNEYGTLTNLPWGVSFSYLEGQRHPVQIYEALFALVLFFSLLRLYRRNIKSINFRSGAVFFYFLFFSSIGRFIFEFLRGDSSYLFGIKLANILSFVLAAFALFSIYFYQFRNFEEDRAKVSKYLFGLRRPFRRRINEPRPF